MRFRTACCVPAALAFASAAFSVHAGVVTNALSTVAVTATAAAAIQRVPGVGAIEVAFSPHQGAEALVLKVIDASRSSIRVMAYSFTSASVTRALVRAVKRGVKVALLVDEKHNLGEGASRNARAALSALSNAGAQVRTIAVYPIFHQKVIIADGQHTQLGSFNYSASAATSNSENVLVNWHNPDLATIYTKNFDQNWAISREFQIRY